MADAGARTFLPLSQRTQAVLWMLTGATSFVLLGSGIKMISDDMHLTVMVFLRSAFGLIILMPILLWQGAARQSTRRLPVHFLRAVVGTLSIYCFFFALQNLPLMNAISISFSSPLWTVMLSILILKERIGWRRRLATAVGFAGVLIILRPGVDFQPAMIVALVGAVLSALVLILVKTMTATERPLVMTMYFSLFGMLFSAPPAFFYWSTPTLEDAALLFGISAIGVAGIYCVARAFALAEAVILAPLDFCRLPMAAALGFLAFGEVPEIAVFVGTAVILVAVYYITRRERDVGAEPPPAVSGPV